MKKNITIILSLALALCSCSSGADSFDSQSVLPADGVIRVAQVGVGTVSRAGAATGANTSDFSLAITNEAYNTFSYKAVMKNENGSWKSYDKNNNLLQMLWQNDTQPVSVLALSLNGSINNSSTQFVKLDQSKENGDVLADKLGAYAQVIPSAPVTANPIYYDEGKRALHINFFHLLSKLRVNVKFTEEFQSGALPTIDSATLSGAWVVYKIPGTSTTPIPEVSTNPLSYDVVMKHETTAETGYAHTFEVIIPPQTDDKKIFIHFHIGDKTYTYAGKFSVSQNRIYTLNLLLGKEVTKISDVTVIDWTTGTTIVDDDEITKPN